MCVAIQAESLAQRTKELAGNNKTALSIPSYLYKIDRWAGAVKDHYSWGWRKTLSWKAGFRQAKAGRAYSCPWWADVPTYGLGYLQGAAFEFRVPDREEHA
jgi:hypothetical protein